MPISHTNINLNSAAALGHGRIDSADKTKDEMDLERQDYQVFQDNEAGLDIDTFGET